MSVKEQNNSTSKQIANDDNVNFYMCMSSVCVSYNEDDTTNRRKKLSHKVCIKSNHTQNT